MSSTAAVKPARKWDPLTPLLVRASTLAVNVPIHTVITFSLLAIFSYVHLLSDMHTSRTSRGLGIANLRDKRFIIGEQTGWNWKEASVESIPSGFEESRKTVLVTLDFPEEAAQHQPVIEIPSILNAIKLDSPRKESAVYAVPQKNLKAFLEHVTELPAIDPSSPGSRRSERWVVTVGNENRNKYNGAWYGFVLEKFDDLWYLLETADPFDIGIMVVGYLAMHGTFINLFLSMRRLGSKFWLAISVLISSTFAFFIAAFVTKALGVPINVILLSEGLPFLVIVIGFEKPIALTRHVLSQSVESRKKSNGGSINSIVLGAVQDKGFEIIKLYALEISVLAVGAILGVQGLRQFCFLAGWILFFDFVLLFSFYTAVLTFKLEINRIRRHANIRRALEEDGISHKAAESYASATEWPKSNLEVYSETGKSGNNGVFGNKIFGVHTFKVLMVGTFFILNVLYIGSFWFRERADALFKSMEKTIPEVHTLPISESSTTLKQIYGLAKQQETVVTVLKPLGYVLELSSSTYPSSSASGIHSQLAESAKDSLFATHDIHLDGPRLLTFKGVVRSLQDPLLSRFLIAILIFSVGLNGLLFNVARWSAKDDHFKPLQTAVPEEKPPVKVCTCGGLMESDSEDLEIKSDVPTKPVEEALALVAAKRSSELTDRDLVSLCATNKLLVRDLERKLGDTTRAVKIRRKVLSLDRSIGEKGRTLEHSKLPYLHYDFDRVLGACCENVVGYLPLPLGIAGPLIIDGEKFYIPMATTEGVLVASTSRGCKAINGGGGVSTVLTDDGMTRGPCVTFPTLKQAGAAKNWLDSPEGQQTMKEAFDSTSRFARLKSIKTALAGTYLYIRFKCTTGDAMGMNMISKGVENALSVMANDCGFTDMQIVSVSGNYCTDKKPAAVNWIEGRGKSVVAEAIIPPDVVKSVLKCDVDGLVELNISKNLVGSAMAGSIGGFNAHAANIVTAIFLATGQDPAQNVESSNCITLMKKTPDGSLQISVSMPSIEVGTLGGGTILDPQGAMLSLLGVKGTHPEGPGQNARKLARIVAASVLAGELSLCSALVAGHLVKSHMQHNRSAPATRSNTPAPPSAASTAREQALANLRMTAAK